MLDCLIADDTPTQLTPVYDPSALPSVLAASASFNLITAVISHGAASFTEELPMLVHVPSRIVTGSAAHPPENCKLHTYDAESPYFMVPSAGPKAYSPGSAALAHSRSLVFLREQLGGPYFDIEAIWDEHTHYEFVDRSVEKTMLTMVVSCVLWVAAVWAAWSAPYLGMVGLGIVPQRLGTLAAYHVVRAHVDSRTSLMSTTSRR